MSEKCSKIKGLMHAALDGELAAGDRARFDEHLAECPACRREYEALTRALAAFEAAPRLEPSPDFAASVMNRARAAKARQGRVRRAFSWVTAGAAVAAGAGAVAFWGRFIVPALGPGAGRLAAGLATTLADGWKVAKAVAVGTDVVGRLLPVFGRAGSLLAREGVRASSPVYVGALVAIALVYLVWRARARLAAPPVALV
jgi:anti-sigma factor RsiW